MSTPLESTDQVHYGVGYNGSTASRMQTMVVEAQRSDGFIASRPSGPPPLPVHRRNSPESDRLMVSEIAVDKMRCRSSIGPEGEVPDQREGDRDQGSARPKRESVALRVMI